MALNIKNEEVERLATEIAQATGETKTEAIRKALEERRGRLAFRVAKKDRAHLLRFLEREIWSEVPRRIQGKRLSRKEWERIVGYGPAGA